MISRQEVLLALRRSLLKGQIDPMFGLEDMGDLNEDLQRFLLQERLLARLGRQWPSVLVSPVDDDYAASTPERAIPMDLRVNTDLNVSLNTAAQEVDDDFWRALNQGLPVSTTPLPSARRSFFEGLGDLIHSRIRWLGRRAVTAAATAPRVTVTSSPVNQQALWTKGHFFSVNTVFGNTIHVRNVAAGKYCFWLSKDTPTPLLPLYDIQQDESIPL
jgi:hypothetical protein